VRGRVGDPPRPVVIRGGEVVTCDAADTVRRADVLVERGRIAAVGRVAPRRDAAEIDARDALVLPGLILTHVHLCQTLFRGAADDLPLLDWLRARIWPLEAAHDAATLGVSAELGLVELLRAGVTTLLDLGTVHDYEVVLDAACRAGVRLFGGKSLMDRGAGVPRRLAEPTRQALASAERLEQRCLADASGRLEYVWIPRFVLSCSERLVRGAVERAAASGALLHTHAAEHPAERAAVRAALGADDVALLSRWGFSGPRASIAHGVQLRPSERRRLAAEGTGVVHCPSANLKLGSGIADLAALDAAGVRLGLGPDGAPCNNNLDPWVELRHAALLASLRAGPGAFPARRVLRLATLDGARMLGREGDLGSVERGKLADLIVVRRDVPHVAPSRDPFGALVYSTQARDVRHVLVGGRPVVADGEVLTLDAARVVAQARRAAARVARRAGL
jgi:5-methylthioadenosine/S-adenosylhomocysteine deaminase